MSERMYRAGIVGCGDIARAHASAYQKHENTDLVAIADIDPRALKTFGSTHAIPTDSWYPDHESLLEGEDLDLVSVCTWHGSHAEISIASAEEGVGGIICEKPMCTSAGEAMEMVKAAKNNDVRLTVEHNRRFSPMTIKARELVSGGVIGTPSLVAVRTGAGLLNWGTHLIDQVRFILGDPETEWVIGQIERRTDRHERREPIEDLCMGIVCFAGGIRMSFESDLPGPHMPGSERNWPAFYGTRGTLTRDGDSLEVVGEEGSRSVRPEETVRGGLLGHLDELIAWIEGEVDDHRCNVSQTYHTLEIMMSIYESVRDRGLVRMPLTTRSSPLKELLDSDRLPVEKPGTYDIRLPYWE